ncbi:hypothetical protein T4E_4443 [Trichinella pseudospiralis]|uniref:Uncharacterized protein n=1 Tax=Trichinella pseudospiralis TaxID=6337 RepID=A0A0V0YJX7_TRIPS|nr:hypothetical protein T4E_4443 [Trichinella pseudospiralis]
MNQFLINFACFLVKPTELGGMMLDPAVVHKYPRSGIQKVGGPRASADRFESVFCRPTSKLTWMNYRTAELFLLAFLTLSLLAVLALATLCATSSPNFIQRVRRPRSGISDQLLAHHSGHGKPSEAPKKNIAYGLDLWNGTTTPYILNKAEREEQLLKLLLKVVQSLR